MKLLLPTIVFSQLGFSSLALINPPVSSCVTEYAPYSLRSVPTYTETHTVTSTYQAQFIRATADVAQQVLRDTPAVEVTQLFSTEKSEDVCVASMPSVPRSARERLSLVWRLVLAFFGSTKQYNALLGRDQFFRCADSADHEAISALSLPSYPISVVCTRTIVFVAPTPNDIALSDLAKDGRVSVSAQPLSSLVKAEAKQEGSEAIIPDLK